MVHTVGFSLFIFSKVAPHPTHRFQFDLSELHKAESRHVRIVRVFLELYIDGFGVFHKKSYTPDAIYMTFGNQTRSTRNKLENIWCVTAVTMYFISDLSRALITAMELSTSLLRKDLLLKGDYVTCWLIYRLVWQIYFVGFNTVFFFSGSTCFINDRGLGSVKCISNRLQWIPKRKQSVKLKILTEC